VGKRPVFDQGKVRKKKIGRGFLCPEENENFGTARKGERRGLRGRGKRNAPIKRKGEKEGPHPLLSSPEKKDFI